MRQVKQLRKENGFTWEKINNFIKKHHKTLERFRSEPSYKVDLRGKIIYT